ncbi:phosphotransferase enzyme family protein [Kribbella sp. NPDC051586]|uniref:phosphotransferase enzyme family protein n=1 Tax=Kribbella sp. NPDC051586 TaxID=3364118 RepID=UPI0037A5067F
MSDLTSFLRERGVEPVNVVPLLGGEKNRSWLVDGAGGSRFVAKSYSTSTRAEVEYELHAAKFVADRGFPTPAPIAAEDGSLRGLIDDRPAALFTYAAGEHPTDLTDDYFSADRQLGRRAAGLAAQLHELCADRSFPGGRTARLDPLRRIQTFLRSPYADLPVLRETSHRLIALQEKMAAVYADPAGLRQGLLHNDISAVNLLLDQAGDITALIDFDDCMTSFQLYDLGRIAETWGRTADRHADLSRINELIEAYNATRPLTDREAELALDLIATYAAATGVDVLTNMLRAGSHVEDPRASYSMLFYLDLCR